MNASRTTLGGARMALHRYPRTKHIEGSAIQPGDDDLDLVPFARFAGAHVVVSEKIDGANAAISFTDNGRLLLQSRSRYLDDAQHAVAPYLGFREWAEEHEDALWPRLGHRYVMFGEWVLTKQTVFYDALPNAFLELDVLDKETEQFLAAPQRRQLLRGLPIESAPILWEGTARSFDDVTRCLGPSRCKTPAWRDELLTAIARASVDDAERFLRETDPSDEMEGVVLKCERDGVVVERAKYVRPGFNSPYLHSSSQWLAARKVRNLVAQSAR